MQVKSMTAKGNDDPPHLSTYMFLIACHLMRVDDTWPHYFINMKLKNT